MPPAADFRERGGKVRTRPVLVRAMLGLGLGVATGAVAGLATPSQRPLAPSSGWVTPDDGQDGDE